jgi:hypothetical protein
MPGKREKAGWFLPEARDHRVRACKTISYMLEAAAKSKLQLSRSTIDRIEGNKAGVSEMSAYAYLKLLLAVAPEYPHREPVNKATILPFEPR